MSWRMISVYVHIADDKLDCGDNYDEMLLNRVSPVLRQQIRNIPGAGPNMVHLENASKGPVKVILDEAKSHGRGTRIRAHQYTFPQAVALYQALEALQFDPAQPQVYGHIKYQIAHKKLEPADLRIVDTILDKGHELWDLLAHHLAWDLHHEKFEDDEARAMINELNKRPNLYIACAGKIDIFTRRDESKARKEAAVAARKDRERVDNIYRERRERKEAREWEETHGLRAASNETIQNVMGGQANYVVFDGTKKSRKRKSKQEAAAE